MDKYAQHYINHYNHTLNKLAKELDATEEDMEEKAREQAREAHRETARKAFAQGYNSAKIKQNKVANDLKPMDTQAGPIPNKSPDPPAVAKHKDNVFKMRQNVLRNRLANDAATAIANKKIPAPTSSNPPT